MWEGKFPHAYTFANPWCFLHFSQTPSPITWCSIVVRTTELDKIEPNLPWLLDAAGCVVLDLFVSLF